MSAKMSDCARRSLFDVTYSKPIQEFYKEVILFLLCSSHVKTNSSEDRFSRMGALHKRTDSKVNERVKKQKTLLPHKSQKHGLEARVPGPDP